VFSDLAAPPQDLSCGPLPYAGPDLAGGRPGAQPNYGSISVTGVSLGAHKTRSSCPWGRGRARRREDRGAEGAEGSSVWGGERGLGRGLCPLPRKFFDFWAQKGEFWCILGAIFFCSWL